MQRSVKTALAGAALIGAVALAANAATPASTRGEDTHILLIQLPNGALEQVEYSGPVAPRVVMAPATVSPAAEFFGQPFDALARIAALMDEQEAMFHQVFQMPGLGGPMPQLPPGVGGYSVVTTVSNGRACTRSTETRFDGRRAEPQTVSTVSGDCGAMPEPRSLPAALPAPAAPTPSAPAAPPRTIRVKATAPAPDHALVQEAFYRHP